MTQRLGAVSFRDHRATVVNPDASYDAIAAVVEAHLVQELPALKWYVPMQGDVAKTLAPMGQDMQDPRWIARTKHHMPIVAVLTIHGQVLSLVLGLDLRLYRQVGIAKALRNIIHKALNILVHGFSDDEEDEDD